MLNYITGIDPGNERTGVVIITSDSLKIVEHEIIDNKILMKLLRQEEFPLIRNSYNAIERIASYGMAVGETVFETCRFSGQLFEACYRYTGTEPTYIPRIQVKNNLCHSSRAKDANIRQALIDRLGPQGTKKNQGATYGVKGDGWAALGVAITYYDMFLPKVELCPIKPNRSK